MYPEYNRARINGRFFSYWGNDILLFEYFLDTKVIVLHILAHLIFIATLVCIVSLILQGKKMRHEIVNIKLYKPLKTE